MTRGSLETTASMGWLGPPAAPSESVARGADLRQSDNWPIPLVVLRDSGAGLSGISAEWFDSSPPESLPPSSRAGHDFESYRVVSRKRLRLAHALFAVAFLSLVALVAWEVNVYYGRDGLARVADWLNGSRR